MEDHLNKRQKILPEQHYLLMGLKLDILNSYGNVRTLQSVQRRLEIIKERISLLSEVDEGCSRLLGNLHYSQQLTHNLKCIEGSSSQLLDLESNRGKTQLL